MGNLSVKEFLKSVNNCRSYDKKWLFFSGTPCMCVYDQDLDGNRQAKLDGVRVQCVACLPDNKTVLAADTHKRVRAYDFDELQDSTQM